MVTKGLFFSSLPNTPNTPRINSEHSKPSDMKRTENISSKHSKHSNVCSLLYCIVYNVNSTKMRSHCNVVLECLEDIFITKRTTFWEDEERHRENIILRVVFWKIFQTLQYVSRVFRIDSKPSEMLKRTDFRVFGVFGVFGSDEKNRP